MPSTGPCVDDQLGGLSEQDASERVRGWRNSAAVGANLSLQVPLRIRLAAASPAAASRLWLFVEELRSGTGVHDVGPDLFFRGHGSLRHGVVGHPCSEFAPRHEAEDGRDQPSGD
jgi:hypothetical protein